MNKQALIELIHENIGGTKAGAEKVMELIIDSIISTLKKGDEVSISGLAIFTANVRKAREARNPRTGETVHVPAMRVPKFKAGKALKDGVK